MLLQVVWDGGRHDLVLVGLFLLSSTKGTKQALGFSGVRSESSSGAVYLRPAYDPTGGRMALQGTLRVASEIGGSLVLVHELSIYAPSQVSMATDTSVTPWKSGKLLLTSPPFPS